MTTAPGPRVQALIDSLSALMVQRLEVARPGMEADLGFLKRHLVDAVWPRLMAAIPGMAEESFVHFTEKYGDLTLNDVLGLVESAKAMKGRPGA